MRKIKLFQCILAILPLIVVLVGLGYVLSSSNESIKNVNEEPIVSVSTEEELVYEGEINGEGRVFNEGDSVSVVLKVNNFSKLKRENLELTLIAEGSSKVSSKETINIPIINPGEEKEVKWDLKGIGGSTKVMAKCNDPMKGLKVIQIGTIKVAGGGWYTGDIHTHTTYSDGSNSPSDNLKAGNNKGLSYINISDHNNSTAFNEGKEAAVNSAQIAFMGSEWTTKEGHAVLMNIKENKNYSAMALDNVLSYLASKDESLIYTAHPFREGALWKGEYKGVNGIEVWNGKEAPFEGGNIKAFKKWDELNASGSHIYGVAGSDAHSIEEIGKVYIKTLCESFTEQGIVGGMLKGHMYGTNGPEISMKVNSSIMGDDYKVSSMGEVVKVHLGGDYYNGISRVKLIRNGEVIVDKEINENSFEHIERVRVVPGDFIRMEVYGKGEEGAVTPFAFSNPIFFVKKG